MARMQEARSGNGSTIRRKRRRRIAVTAIELVIVTIMWYRSHHYIVSTLSGTRIIGGEAIEPHSETFEECRPRLYSSLEDFGDAGRIWLKHAGVGTSTKLEQRTRYGCKCQMPQVYETDTPEITAIVQSYNHKANIKNISNSLLTATKIEEIIICEDGSSDGSLEEWSSVLRDTRHFIIRSNNLHELRAYNRALRISSGEFLLLLQDDDLLPPTQEWINDALKLFHTYPKLGILGGYIGQLWNHDDKQYKGFEYGEQVSTHGGVRSGNTKKIPFYDPNSGIPFMFVECAWIAPIFIRRELLEKVGGLNLEIAKRGEPGVWQDCVYCLEAWVNGFSVGVFSAPFTRGVGGHGSATSDEKLKMRQRVYERAVALANRRYKRSLVHKNVVTRNSRLLNSRFH